MKNLLSILFFTCVSVFVYGQDTGPISKEDCKVRNLTLNSINETKKLYQYLVDETRSGIIKMHPFTLEEYGGWDSFLSNLKTDPNISLVYLNSTPSRLLDGTFHKYGQYYKGIEVIDGGFTIFTNTENVHAIAGPPCPGCPPINPCDEIQMLSSYIYEDINISAIPSISEVQIAQSLNISLPHIISKELKIVHNITQNCEYRLTYLTNYTSEKEGDMVGWVDAHSGQFLHKAPLHNNKNAPTANFGIQFMNDTENGNLTELRNQRLRCYDMTGNQGNNFNENDIPASPIIRDWEAIDANPEVFQLFWMTDLVIEELNNRLGINFINVRVGFQPTFGNAISIAGGLPNNQADFVFGVINGVSTVEFDVVAHELGHAIIRQFISSALPQGGSLHEGISDMFGTFIESILDPNGLDWVMGDDMPLAIRDLQNTTRNCFTDIQNLTSNHDRSEALGHWFFLCVNGSAANNIPPMNIEEVMNLIVDALPNLGSNADYPDLMRATMAIAAMRFGTCSNQFRTILRAWEQICVPTGHRMANTNISCVDLQGNTSVCEENNYISICLSPNAVANTNFGRWTIIGRNSTSFQSIRGMQGNSQEGGNCIEIYQIPDMPFYPQTITIQYWHPQIGQTITRRVVIRDCDRDDPTCSEYYNTSLRSGQDEQIYSQFKDIHYDELTLRNKLENEDLKLVIYDLMGNIVSPSTNIADNNFKRPQILLYTYWDKNGTLVDTKKVFVRQ